MNSPNEALPPISLESISRAAASVPTTEFKGFWRSIELQPDLFVPQTFCVGVLVGDHLGAFAYKILDDHKKFECIYGDRFPAQTRHEFLEYLRITLKQAATSNEIAFETSNIHLSEPHFTSGGSLSATASRLYEEIVVMAPHKPRRSTLTIETAEARKLVNAELLRIASSDYQRIVVPAEAPITMDAHGKKRKLDINLAPGSTCGTVLSAVYATSQSVEINFLKSSLDLTTYANAKGIEHPGIFLLLPGNRLEPTIRRRISEIVEEQSWKLEREGVRFCSVDSEAKLAEEIYTWAKPELEAA